VGVPLQNVDEEVEHYDIEDATESNAAILYKVFGNIQKWTSWEASNKKGTFMPLQLTIQGTAGTGKSFIINTIVSCLRGIFYDTGVAHGVSPIRMAALNVLEETLHRFTGLDWEKMKKDISKRTQEKLQKKYTNDG
jgi:hypothetical protein